MHLPLEWRKIKNRHVRLFPFESETETVCRIVLQEANSKKSRGRIFENQFSPQPSELLIFLSFN